MCGHAVYFSYDYSVLTCVDEVEAYLATKVKYVFLSFEITKKKTYSLSSLTSYKMKGGQTP